MYSCIPTGVHGPTRTFRANLTPFSIKGEWVHWAGTYDGQTMKLYVNGKLVATDAATQHGDIMYPPPTYIQRVNQVTYFVPTQCRQSNVVLNKYNASAQIPSATTFF